MMSRLPTDAKTIPAFFNYNALAYDMASMLSALATRGKVIVNAGDDCERLAELAKETIDVGAAMFSADEAAVHGNPTVIWADD